MKKAILFDLDGTLLPMNQEKFTKAYFQEIIKIMDKYDSSFVISNIYRCINAMVNNTGIKTNEEVFWNELVNIYGNQILEDKIKFDDFYLNKFDDLKNTCSYNKLSNVLIKRLKEKGYIIVLATNPLFPAVATETRMKWAGLDKNDFILYTTYENSYHCKPNLDYYHDILKYINCSADECIMIGNDVDEDMVAFNLGMETFLLTDCLINKNHININQFNYGNINDLEIYINSLPNIN